MQNISEQINWYALQVASRKEKPVAAMLFEKGYESYLPLYPKRSAWCDRIKVTLAPLFQGYVFCKFDVLRRLPILLTPNVYGIVGSGKVPVAIPDAEVMAVSAAIEHGLPLEPCDALHEGDPVRVTRGPLAGFQGHFVRYRGSCRLILSVPTIQRSVAVEIDRLWVEPILQPNRVECDTRPDTRL